MKEQECNTNINININIHVTDIQRPKVTITRKPHTEIKIDAQNSETASHIKLDEQATAEAAAPTPEELETPAKNKRQQKP
ncbi:hypothetical protein DA717_09650, partial [Piscirickettsiaceae bacterium NZ-RLO2]